MNHFLLKPLSFFHLHICCQVGSCFWETRWHCKERDIIIQTGDKGSSPSVGKHPSYWSVLEQKCRIPASCTWLSALTSLWEDKQSTGTMINERSGYYLIFSYWRQLSSFAILYLCLLLLSSDFFFPILVGFILMSSEETLIYLSRQVTQLKAEINSSCLKCLTECLRPKNINAWRPLKDMQTTGEWILKLLLRVL